MRGAGQDQAAARGQQRHVPGGHRAGGIRIQEIQDRTEDDAHRPGGVDDSSQVNSATLIADARHSWLDALSSAGALAGLVAVALGQFWGDTVAGLAVTAFICHVGYEVTADVLHRLADGVDPEVITRAAPD